VDERYDAPLPAHCPDCAGPVVQTGLNPHAVLVSMLHAREPIVPPVFQETTAN